MEIPRHSSILGSLTEFAPDTSHVDEDLRNVDLTGQVLFYCDFRGANLYNAKISLNCATFHGLKLDDTQVATLLRLVGLAQIDAAWKDGLRLLIESIIGKDRNDLLSRYLKIHI